MCLEGIVMIMQQQSTHRASAQHQQTHVTHHHHHHHPKPAPMLQRQVNDPGDRCGCCFCCGDPFSSCRATLARCYCCHCLLRSFLLLLLLYCSGEEEKTLKQGGLEEMEKYISNQISLNSAIPLVWCISCERDVL
ncbi:unnamed protein product [Pleuronectes platessa]|uniref:Uncharacterized protein n=1 Tax=Pleuronectes platessa TaxID=8262 RepID=A0A9N7U7B3_PLEPL|nr:unnamed protein product [Pleuronectes platessa]